GECDWILYTHLSVARVQAFVPALMHRPYGVFIHGIEVWRPLTDEQRAVLKGAALLVANSAFTARCVGDMHPDIGTVVSCPLALPEAGLASTRADNEAVDHATRAVLLVARMSASERYKGHDELLEAWPMVIRQVPDATLIFAGDGDDAGRLRAKAADLGLGAAVTFTGFVEDAELRSLYRKAAVFAMPSRGEGFGLVYLEAMSHHLPCIGALDDAAGGIIVDGVTGFLVKQADRDALTDRIVRLLSDEALRRSMGRAGYRRVQGEFRYDQFSRRMVSLIESHFDVAARAWSPEVAHEAQSSVEPRISEGDLPDLPVNSVGSAPTSGELRD
ncbi:MAG: glycosyltransferase family 4 protein, partial [Vicinamibacterales bacterium]